MDPAGAEEAALPGHHRLPAQRQGESAQLCISGREAAAAVAAGRWSHLGHLQPRLTVAVLCLLFTQMWEKAIELGKQLAKMHESHMFDFMELSQLLVRSPAHQTVHTGTASLQEHGA